MYDERGQCAPPGGCMQSLIPPHPSELLHLNQACVQDLICDLADAQPSTI